MRSVRLSRGLVPYYTTTTTTTTTTANNNNTNTHTLYTIHYNLYYTMQ